MVYGSDAELIDGVSVSFSIHLAVLHQSDLGVRQWLPNDPRQLYVLTNILTVTNIAQNIHQRNPLLPLVRRAYFRFLEDLLLHRHIYHRIRQHDPSSATPHDLHPHRCRPLA